MLRYLIEALKFGLSLVGIVAFKRSTGIFLPESETPALICRLAGKDDPVVVDGGAHKGDMVVAIRAIAPAAKFICFEPDPELASGLAERFAGDRHVIVVGKALGATSGRAAININAGRATTSLLESNAANDGALRDLITTVRKVDVDIVTLDDEVATAGYESCDIIKLDLQGFDYMALRGAERLLKRASVVLVEVWYAPVYEAAHTYLDVCNLLTSHGFSLYSLAGLHYGPGGRLLWSDAIFISQRSPAFAERIQL